jgi:glucokinase
MYIFINRLPYGGLFLCGGLTPKNIDLIKDPNGIFMNALLDKVCIYIYKYKYV